MSPVGKKKLRKRDVEKLENTSVAGGAATTGDELCHSNPLQCDPAPTYGLDLCGRVE